MMHHVQGMTTLGGAPTQLQRSRQTAWWQRPEKWNASPSATPRPASRFGLKLNLCENVAPCVHYWHEYDSYLLSHGGQQHCPSMITHHQQVCYTQISSLTAGYVSPLHVSKVLQVLDRAEIWRPECCLWRGAGGRPGAEAGAVGIPAGLESQGP